MAPSKAPTHQASVTLDQAVVDAAFCQSPAAKPLRVCCYGSSSSQTPLAYLTEAAHTGYVLAKRGHTVVNGAGSFGCMAALNQGAHDGDGHIVGVIHEMWLVDNWNNGAVTLRDGGAHPVFDQSSIQRKHGGPHPALKQEKNGEGPKREMLVAGGEDLQERKRLLVQDADALIVLPGGPGTWDELWEMACARNIGLAKLPIVCVNVNGYYDPFLAMLERAHSDGLTKLRPDEILHFEDSAEAAVRWIESVQDADAPAVVLKKRADVLRQGSILHTPSIGEPLLDLKGRLRQSLTSFSEAVFDPDTGAPKLPWLGVAFAAGVGTGMLLLAGQRNLRR